MKITDILPNNTALSPLAGYTDVGFRALAKQYGCGLTTTEMVSAKALSMGNHITKSLLDTTSVEKPVAVQLFGHDPEVFKRVVDMAELQKFDIIDINMGCPMRKIVNNGDGSALLENPLLATELVKAALTGGKFVTVKFRLGVEDNSMAKDFARRMEDAGANALTVHGRTRNQMYSGKADWDTIAHVVEAVNIPVYGNGDVTDKESFQRLLRHTGCYGVAIGRGAIGKPYIFAEVQDKPYEFDTLSAILKHFVILEEHLPSNVVVNEMKKQCCYYLKGYRGNKEVVVKIQQAKSVEAMLSSLRDFLGTATN